MSGDKTKRELTTGDKHATPDVLAWMPPLALSRPWTFGIVLPRSSRHIPVVSAVDGLEATKTPQASFDGIPAATGEARAQTAMAEAPGQKAEGVAADQRPSPPPATRGRQAGPVTAPMRGPPAARPLAGKQTAGNFQDAPASCQDPLVFPQSPQAFAACETGPGAQPPWKMAGVLVLATPSHARTRTNAPGARPVAGPACVAAGPACAGPPDGAGLIRQERRPSSRRLLRRNCLKSSAGTGPSGLNPWQ